MFHSLATRKQALVDLGPRVLQALRLPEKNVKASIKMLLILFRMLSRHRCRQPKELRLASTLLPQSLPQMGTALLSRKQSVLPVTNSMILRLMLLIHPIQQKKPKSTPQKGTAELPRKQKSVLPVTNSMILRSMLLIHPIQRKKPKSTNRLPQPGYHYVAPVKLF